MGTHPSVDPTRVVVVTTAATRSMQTHLLSCPAMLTATLATPSVTAWGWANTAALAKALTALPFAVTSTQTHPRSHHQWVMDGAQHQYPWQLLAHIYWLAYWCWNLEAGKSFFCHFDLRCIFECVPLGPSRGPTVAFKLMLQVWNLLLQQHYTILKAGVQLLYLRPST